MRRFPVCTISAATLTALCWGAMSPGTLAQSYEPPPGLGLPGPREGAGTRGCILGNPGRLILLTPAENVGWTTEAYPEFYWQQPIALDSVVQFSLYRAVDDTPSGGDLVYEARFPGSFDAGIARLQLPENLGIEPLTAGDRYYWQVSIFCDTDSDEPTQAAVGWIERQSPSAELEAALADATPTEQVDLYITGRYWYNLLDVLADLRQTAPEDEAIQQAWAALLDSVGLEILVDQPFLHPPSEADDLVEETSDAPATTDQDRPPVLPIPTVSPSHPPAQDSGAHDPR
jgi:hypothetical protein